MFTPISQDIFQNNATRGHMKGEGSSLPPKQRENENEPFRAEVVCAPLTRSHVKDRRGNKEVLVTPNNEGVVRVNFITRH